MLHQRRVLELSLLFPDLLLHDPVQNPVSSRKNLEQLPGQLLPVPGREAISIEEFVYFHEEMK